MMLLSYYHTWLVLNFVAGGVGDVSAKQNSTVKNQEGIFLLIHIPSQMPHFCLYSCVRTPLFRADQLEELLAIVLLTADLLRNCCFFFLVRVCIYNGITKAKDLINWHFLKISMHYYGNNGALPICIGLNLCSKICSCFLCRLFFWLMIEYIKLIMSFIFTFKVNNFIKY